MTGSSFAAERRAGYGRYRCMASLRDLGRVIASLLALVASFALGASRADAADVARDAFTLSAKSVTFYADRFVIVGDEDVDVLLADGTRITGDTFQMDLRLNRFIIAGSVRVQFGEQQIEGAAFSEFLDFHRTYFVPITTEPDRWTFVDGDFAHPLLGREMPGDVFALPDMSDEHPFIRSKRAVITPRESVRFTPATVNSGAGWIPTPNWFLNFSNNPNFVANSLSGANVDVPYSFAGSSHSLSTVHLRYDQYDHIFGAFEQHLVFDRGYVVGSINPITKPQKQYNIVAYDRASPTFAAQLLLQENAYQYGLNMPLSASAFVNLQLTKALHQSYLQFLGNLYFYSLLADPAPLTYYGNPSFGWNPNHPVDWSLVWQGFDHRINKLPVSFRLRSGFGYTHNGVTPIQTLGGVAYPTVWQHLVGGTLYTAPLRLNRDKLSRDTLLNLSFDTQRQWFSSPHYIDTTSGAATVSKTFSRQFSVFVGYTITQTSDIYGAQQLEAYPPTIPTSLVTGETYPGYAAFRGLGTTRSLVGSLIFKASPRVAGSLIYRTNSDFPVPIPVPSYPPGTLVQSPYGVSPQLLTGDLRIRISPTILLDFNRSYAFGWGNYHVTPQWGFTIEK
jgi:hypothetical protein